MLDVFTSQSPLILVGCGNMGRAMAEGWLKAGLSVDALYVADPMAKAGALPGVPAANYVVGIANMPEGVTAKAVILAVKPQIMDKVLPDLHLVCDADSLVISVAAGVTLAQMRRGADIKAGYVRSMPNTPAAVGAGITGLTAEGLSDADKELSLNLLSATGSALWIEDESQMDAVTAVSGSGPAYVFLMVEAMAAAGAAEGLPADVAMALARQTIIGAGALMAAEADVAAEELRRRVTSPGGTTAAGLGELLEDEALHKLMHKAVKAARIRGGELAG